MEVMKKMTKSSTADDFQAFSTLALTEKIESHIRELVMMMNEREKFDA
jgi:hypothetical protein